MGVLGTKYHLSLIELMEMACDDAVYLYDCYRHIQPTNDYEP